MRAVLFDLDRTLVDVQSHTDYPASLAEVESLIGEWDDPPTPPTGWNGPTRRAMGILVALAGDPRWESVSEIIERHERGAVDRSVAMPGLESALESTRHRARGVVTLLPTSVANEVLALHGVDIPVVVGRRPVLAVKPSPDQLLAACISLGVEPAEAVMIGDSTWDAETARTAGCRFVGVTNGSVSEFADEVAVAETLDRAVALVD